MADLEKDNSPSRKNRLTSKATFSKILRQLQDCDISKDVFEPVAGTSSSEMQTDLEKTQQSLSRLRLRKSSNNSEIDPSTAVNIKQQTDVSTNVITKKSKYKLRKDEKSGLYCCKYCTVKSSHATTMKEHMSVHSRPTPYHCTLCSHKAKKKSHLQRHIQTHGRNLFTCAVCAFSTSQKAHLTQHSHLHDIERKLAIGHFAKTGATKPFACPVCKFTTSRKKSMRTHTLTSHRAAGPMYPMVK